MNKSILLIVVFFFGFTAQFFGQGYYKTKNSRGIGQFIVPPDTYWGYKENGNKKCGYDRYYYVFFYGLDKDYIKSISELDYADCSSGNIDYFDDESKLPKSNALSKKIKERNTALIQKANFKKSITTNLFQGGHLAHDNSVYFIQIDYNTLIDTNIVNTINNFNQLAKEILIEISGKEEEFNWPTSICQNLVEKVFELIPIPQEAALARYGLIQNSSFSLLPLNPKIHLRVDHASLYDSRTSDDVTNTQLYLDYLKALIDTNDTAPEKNSKTVQVPLERERLQSALQASSWRFQFTGQSIISYSKFQDNNGDVFFKFDPFIGSKYTKVGTDNDYPDASRKLLASSVDIEFTSILNNSKYLFLFQQYLRDNNSNSGTSGAIGRCCGENPLRCNSLIFYSDDMNLLSSNFKDCEIITNYAIFGERSPIVPLILIEVNSNKLFIPFGYTVFDLISNGYIKAAFRLKREFSGTTRPFKNPNLETLLLPGDVIKSE